MKGSFLRRNDFCSVTAKGRTVELASKLKGKQPSKWTTQGFKLSYSLYNSKRPEVISRLMQGQLNFLPLTTDTNHHAQLSAAFSEPQSAQSVHPVPWLFTHNPATAVTLQVKTIYTRQPSIGGKVMLLFLLPGRLLKAWSHCEAVGREWTTSWPQPGTENAACQKQKQW